MIRLFCLWFRQRKRVTVFQIETLSLFFLFTVFPESSKTHQTDRVHYHQCWWKSRHHLPTAFEAASAGDTSCRATYRDGSGPRPLCPPLPPAISGCGGADIIVVAPALVAGVVGRVNIDALHLALILRQQGFQCFKIIAVDDHVLTAVVFDMLPLLIKTVLPLQHPEGNFLMMVHDFIFTDPFQG